MKALSPISYLLLGLALISFFAGLGSNSIYILDEAKNAEAAREMWESGNWLAPTFNGEPRYDKPPLHYFFFSLAYQIWGVNAFAARFFSALAGWICSVLVFARVRERLGERSAIWAFVALLASIQWGIQFRLAVPDPLLILFLTASVLALERFFHESDHSKVQLRWAAFFLALAFLSKGPVAVVLVGGTVILYLLLQKHSEFRWTRLLDPVTILLFCLVALPWYVLVYLQNGDEWLRQFVFTHNVSRFSQPMEGHGGPFYLPWLFALGGFFPGTLFLFLPWSKNSARLRSHPLLLLSLIFVLVTVGFFSLSSTKLPGYVAPAFPFLAILLGWRVKELDRLRGFRMLSIVLALFLIVVVACVALTGDRQEALLGFRVSWLPFLALVPFAALAIWKRERTWGAFVILAIDFWVLKWILFTQVAPLIDAANPVSLSTPALETGSEVYYWKHFNPAFPFRLQRIVQPWDEGAAPEALIITEQKYLETFPMPYEEIFRAKDRFEGKETVIIRRQSAEPSSF